MLGCLFDLMSQDVVCLCDVEVLILDEVDQMFDMGFIYDFRKIIVEVLEDCQMFLFLVMMLKLIEDFVGKYLDDLVCVLVVLESIIVECVIQGVFYVLNNYKLFVFSILLENLDIDCVLVFMCIKYGVDKVVCKLMVKGYKVFVIYGNKFQLQCLKVFVVFKFGDCWVLIVIDIVVCGIDIDGISYVINFEMLNIVE